MNNTKFYAVDNTKNSLEALKQAAHLDLFEDREKIFSEHRPALMKLIRFDLLLEHSNLFSLYFRDSTKNISKVCDGFLKDPKHLEEHFLYLTAVNISMKIERGLVGHMGKDYF